MVNTRMFVFKHPKYYKELRTRNKSDQVISGANATAKVERAPGPGHKLQATSSKPQANQNQFRFRQPQAPSDKRPNQSSKHQASSHKQQAQRFLNHGTRKLKKFSWVKDRGPLP